MVTTYHRFTTRRRRKVRARRSVGAPGYSVGGGGVASGVRAWRIMKGSCAAVKAMVSNSRPGKRNQAQTMGVWVRQTASLIAALNRKKPA